MTADIAMRPLTTSEHRSPRRVLIVDGNEIVQAGLRGLLSSQDWVERCLCTATPAHAVELTRKHHPHVALVDLSVAGTPGAEVCRTLLEQAPFMRVILMSQSGRLSRANAAAAGARGFFTKELSAGGIVEAVRRVSEGASFFAREVSPVGNRGLSAREQEVLQHLVLGMSNPEVASALHLSRHTVKQHTSTVYRKLGVRNRAEAVGLARQLGLVA